MNQFHTADSLQAYLAQLPPDLRQRAADYTHGGHWIVLLSAIVGVLINLVIVRLGVLPKIRQRWERRRPRPWSASLLVFAAYYLLAWLLDLPWALYARWWREVHYGFSTQKPASWLAESLISAGFSALLLGLLVMLLYALMRRSPRHWWIWSSLIGAGALLLMMVIAPAVIEPAFNDFKPLPPSPQRNAIDALATQAGIASDRIVWYDGSKQSSNYTAHVSGLSGSARVAISDTLLHEASTAELRAVVGHEIGHYVLHHTLWLTLGYSVLLTLVFLVAHWRLGPQSDPAGLPKLSILFTLCFLLLTPFSNGMTRLAENQADAYSLAHAQEPDGMAIALLRTADYRAPEPDWLEEWLFYDHPSIASRIQRTLTWKGSQPVQDR
jgi:STE24 endopeptidase